MPQYITMPVLFNIRIREIAALYKCGQEDLSAAFSQILLFSVLINSCNFMERGL